MRVACTSPVDLQVVDVPDIHIDNSFEVYASLAKELEVAALIALPDNVRMTVPVEGELSDDNHMLGNTIDKLSETDPDLLLAVTVRGHDLLTPCDDRLAMPVSDIQPVVSCADPPIIVAGDIQEAPKLEPNTVTLIDPVENKFEGINSFRFATL